VITFTYRSKIKPTKQQIIQIEQYLDICRSVYNFAQAERKAWLESRKSKVDRCSLVSEYILPADLPFPGYNEQAKSLTKAKQKIPHLKLVNAQCLQQVLKQLDRAWIDFFRVSGRGFPKFKNKNRFRSFVFPQLGKDCLANGRVKLPSIGIVRIRQSREYPTGFTPKQFRIVRRATGYYLMVTFSSNESVPDPIPGKISIGLDAGIESFVATPNELIKSPKFVLNKTRKLKLLQRKFKKKTKGSKNWLKLQSKVAKTHEKVANTRRDWHFKLSHQICSVVDNIFGEDINFNSWSRGLFCKQSLDSGIGGFINEVLPFVAWKQGKYYLKADKNGTSRECPKCNQFTGKKELNQRVHICQFCQHQESRDTASAKIIMQRGQRAVGHTVFKNACGDVLTGIGQDILPNLVKSRRTKNPPVQLDSVVQTLD
jgi:putative transposase